MMRNCRFMLKIVLLLLLLIAQTASGQQKELRKIRFNGFRIDSATVAAQVNGFFTAEGLDVDATITLNSTDQMRGLSQGKFDIVSTAFDNVLAWSGKEGADIIAIAQISDKTVLSVFVRPEIKDWSDLKGKSLQPMLSTLPLHWFYGVFCSRMVWI